VEGREGDGVGDPGGEVHVAEPGELPADLGPEPFDLLPGVHHRVDEPGHPVGGYAGQVVAHREVEDKRSGVRAEEGGDLVPAAQHLDDHPGLDVLLQGLGDLELLAPFDVVADGLHVDARPADLEFVHDLDGLELHEPGASQPGQHDVLGHLAVRPGGRADRSRRRPSQEVDRYVGALRHVEESGRRQVVDTVPALPLVADPGQEVGQAEGREGLVGLGHPAPPDSG